MYICMDVCLYRDHKRRCECEKGEGKILTCMVDKIELLSKCSTYRAIIGKKASVRRSTTVATAPPAFAPILAP